MKIERLLFKNGKNRQSYSYSSSVFNSVEDQGYPQFHWDYGTISGWFEHNKSDVATYASHIWMNK